MILAKLALGMAGTMALAGVYTCREGMMRIDVDEAGNNGSHVHLWMPAAVVPMAVRFVPQRHLEQALQQAGPWMPTLRTIAKELKKYPEAELVEVRDAESHVRVRVHDGKLMVDAVDSRDDVHVACPLAMIEDLANELEAKIPRA
jgi:hypothetical protein